MLLHYACMLCHFSCFSLFLTSWTAAHQTPQSMEFSRQEHWSGLPFPSPGDLPNPGIKPGSSVAPELQSESSPLSYCGSPSNRI